MSMALRDRRLRAIRTLVSPRTWRQVLMVMNFYGYDSAEVAKATLATGVALSPTVSVRNGARLSVGANSEIGQGCFLWAGDSHATISLGQFALLAPGVFVTCSNYHFDASSGPVMQCGRNEADVVIGSNTWLGANAIVLPGVTIGDGAIVAAGSVVSRNVEPGVLVAGVPARVVRRRGADARVDQTIAQAL